MPTPTMDELREHIRLTRAKFREDTDEMLKEAEQHADALADAIGEISVVEARDTWRRDLLIAIGHKWG